MNKIIINSLTKSFGKTKVLNEISMEISPGIFGLIGPNGAGKTTLMKCILGLYSYRGSISFKGDKEQLKRIGYLPQQFELLQDLTVQEAMEYFSLLKGKLDQQEIHKLLSWVHLEDEKKKKLRKLSGGMRRRLGIAQALLKKPGILIIDEPTAGLDPQERVSFRNLLSDLPRDIIVLISTHILEDLAFVAGDLAFIHQGVCLKQGGKRELLEGLYEKVYEWEGSFEEALEYKRKYLVTRESTHSEGKTHLRLISDEKVEGAKPVLSEMEDLYFYYLGNKR